MPAVDGDRTLLTAILLSMKHSIESVRKRVDSHSGSQSQSSITELGPGENVTWGGTLAAAAMAPPGQHRAWARPDRTPPLRRRVMLPLPLPTGNRALAFATRSYEEFSGEYTALQELHAGTYGSVTCYQRRVTEERVAVKTIKVRRENVLAVKREVDISLQLNHPGIVRTLGVYSRREDSTVLLVQEYAAGGDLFEFISGQGPVRDEALAKSIFTQLCSALIHLHENVGICHRDVKPENVLLIPCVEGGDAQGQERFKVVLTDFGLSQHSSPSAKEPVRGIAGTEGYMSPEVASLPIRGGGFVDGRAADVWSLAVLMYTVLMASLPWNTPLPADPYYSEYILRRKTGEVGAVFGHSHEARAVFTKALGELFDRMLAPNVQDRITLREALEYASLPWFVPEQQSDAAASAPSAAYAMSLRSVDEAAQVQKARAAQQASRGRGRESSCDIVEWAVAPAAAAPCRRIPVEMPEQPSLQESADCAPLLPTPTAPYDSRQQEQRQTDAAPSLLVNKPRLSEVTLELSRLLCSMSAGSSGGGNGGSDGRASPELPDVIRSPTVGHVPVTFSMSARLSSPSSLSVVSAASTTDTESGIFFVPTSKFRDDAQPDAAQDGQQQSQSQPGTSCTSPGKRLLAAGA